MTYTSYLYFFGFVVIVYVFYLLFPLRHRWKVLLAGSCLFSIALDGFLSLCLFVTAFSSYFCGLKLTKLQESTIRKILAAGGTALVVHSVDEVRIAVSGSLH